MKSNEITINDLKGMLISKKYISKMKHIEKNAWNVSKLLGKLLTQQQSIKFGNMFQDIIKEWITSFGAVVSEVHFVDCYETGNKKGNKGKKDMDLLFTYNGILYYYECKVSAGLDSEKTKATNKKVQDITDYLTKTQTLPVVSGVLTAWYEKESKMSVTVNNVVFMSDLFNIFDFTISKEEYNSMLNEFGKQI
jgi:hypothetical protein